MPKGGPRKFDHDECRALYATGEWTQKQLAERFGVSQSRVCQVVDLDRYARANASSTQWTREHYHTTCSACGSEIWKKGNKPTQTGLCVLCLGVSQRTAEHGTESRYQGGCGCAACKRASAEARRARRHANIEATRASDREYKRRRNAA